MLSNNLLDYTLSVRTYGDLYKGISILLILLVQDECKGPEDTNTFSVLILQYVT